MSMAHGLATLASSLDGGAPELSGRGIKRGAHGFASFRALHAVQKIVELRPEVIESEGARLRQRLEFLIGEKHRLGCVVASNRDGARMGGFVQDRAELVFSLSGCDGGDINQRALAISKCQRGHCGTSMTVIIANLAILSRMMKTVRNLHRRDAERAEKTNRE